MSKVFCLETLTPLFGRLTAWRIYSKWRRLFLRCSQITCTITIDGAVLSVTITNKALLIKNIIENGGKVTSSLPIIMMFYSLHKSCNKGCFKLSLSFTLIILRLWLDHVSKKKLIVSYCIHELVYMAEEI